MSVRLCAGALLALITTALMYHCKRGSCERVTCLNGGTCRNGRCKCPVGFEGGRCEVKWTDRWIGNYTVDDRCQQVGLIPEYEARITASTVYPDVVYLEPFGDLSCEGGQPVRAEGRLISINRIRIEKQALCNRRYSVSGEGTFDPNRRTATLTYYFWDLQGNISDTCTSTWRKY